MWTRHCDIPNVAVMIVVVVAVVLVVVVSADVAVVVEAAFEKEIAVVAADAVGCGVGKPQRSQQPLQMVSEQVHLTWFPADGQFYFDEWQCFF